MFERLKFWKEEEEVDGVQVIKPKGGIAPGTTVHIKKNGEFTEVQQGPEKATFLENFKKPCTYNVVGVSEDNNEVEVKVVMGYHIDDMEKFQQLIHRRAGITSVEVKELVTDQLKDSFNDFTCKRNLESIVKDGELGAHFQSNTPFFDDYGMKTNHFRMSIVRPYGNPTTVKKIELRQQVIAKKVKKQDVDINGLKEDRDDALEEISDIKDGLNGAFEEIEDVRTETDEKYQNFEEEFYRVLGRMDRRFGNVAETLYKQLFKLGEGLEDHKSTTEGLIEAQDRIMSRLAMQSVSQSLSYEKVGEIQKQISDLEGMISSRKAYDFSDDFSEVKEKLTGIYDGIERIVKEGYNLTPTSKPTPAPKPKIQVQTPRIVQTPVEVKEVSKKIEIRDLISQLESLDIQEYRNTILSENYGNIAAKVASDIMGFSDKLNKKGESMIVYRTIKTAIEECLSEYDSSDNDRRFPEIFADYISSGSFKETYKKNLLDKRKGGALNVFAVIPGA